MFGIWKIICCPFRMYCLAPYTVPLCLRSLGSYWEEWGCSWKALFMAKKGVQVQVPIALFCVIVVSPLYLQRVIPGSHSKVLVCWREVGCSLENRSWLPRIKSIQAARSPSYLGSYQSCCWLPVSSLGAAWWQRSLWIQWMWVRGGYSKV